MDIELTEAIARLSATADAIAALVRAVPEAQAGWRARPGKWSVLEIVNHLADEEVEDFRTRLDLTLHRPAEPWPPIDPEGWVVQRDYRSRELSESLWRFLAERERSLAWLGSLQEPRWELTRKHPHVGTLSAGALLASWLAHDLLHIRQLTRLHYHYLAERARPDSLDYAGEW